MVLTYMHEGLQNEEKENGEHSRVSGEDYAVIFNLKFQDTNASDHPPFVHSTNVKAEMVANYQGTAQDTLDVFRLISLLYDRTEGDL